MMKKHDPILFIISAPSGTGKGTLVARLLAEVPDLERIITSTTRQKRDGEIENVSYIYLDTDDFLARRENGGFVEWNQIYGNYYGTLKSSVYEAIERGKEQNLDFLVEIDVDGKRNFCKAFTNTVSILIMPPSLEELSQRILGRNSETDDQVTKRLARAEEELSRKDEFDYNIINDDLDQAVSELVQIIEKHRG